MTRIIAGSARGNPLRVPPGAHASTTDRVREAFFCAGDLGRGQRAPADQQLAGIRLLDLYAGSGAIGLEAASRGARDVVLVDSFRPAVEIIRRNAAATKLADRVSVRASDVGAFLGKPPAAPFDVIWLDPFLRVGRPRVGRGALPARRWLAGPRRAGCGGARPPRSGSGLAAGTG